MFGAVGAMTPGVSTRLADRGPSGEKVRRRLKRQTGMRVRGSSTGCRVAQSTRSKVVPTHYNAWRRMSMSPDGPPIGSGASRASGAPERLSEPNQHRRELAVWSSSAFRGIHRAVGADRDAYSIRIGISASFRRLSIQAAPSCFPRPPARWSRRRIACGTGGWTVDCLLENETGERGGPVEVDFNWDRPDAFLQEDSRGAARHRDEAETGQYGGGADGWMPGEGQFGPGRSP